ncbi:unannotated protein [freshwater metagenome]|uniref:Unannotated protein n=1 Tax=freshwater metagenome TaxID=449393 RepID=A0A6J7FRA3_9ZZZZ|nr:hypothetical protein [Actinomycetota bacterium]
MPSIPLPVPATAQAAIAERPTGSTAIVAGALVTIAGRAGVDLTLEEGVAIVVLATAVVSWLTPRFDARRATARNVPSAGGTGPDSTG